MDSDLIRNSCFILPSSVMCRFFISAPGVFHVGVNEKVFVQVGPSHLHKPITLYLEHEINNALLSAKKTVSFTELGQVQTTELMVRGPSTQNDDHSKVAARFIFFSVSSWIGQGWQTSKEIPNAGPPTSRWWQRALPSLRGRKPGFWCQNTGAASSFRPTSPSTTPTRKVTVKNAELKKVESMWKVIYSALHL